jgi:GlpG protein
MKSESVSTSEVGAPTPAAAPGASQPWLSRLAVVACIAIYVGLALHDDQGSLEMYGGFGYLPADEVWSGGYWALVTSAFVHVALGPLVFNVFWLWSLGGYLERALGSGRFLAFVLASAFVTSSFQLAISNTTGLGASGVVYAIFAFMWATRRRYPSFREVLDTTAIQLFAIWLVGCLTVTYLGVWPVGNTAHFAGLAFGGTVAGAFVLPYGQRLVRAALAAIVLLAIIPLFWCPWSVPWLYHKATEADSAGQLHVAIDLYTEIIRRDANDARAYICRSFVYEQLGMQAKSDADWQTARRLDPMLADPKMRRGRG